MLLNEIVDTLERHKDDIIVISFSVLQNGPADTAIRTIPRRAIITKIHNVRNLDKAALYELIDECVKRVTKRQNPIDAMYANRFDTFWNTVRHAYEQKQLLRVIEWHEPERLATKAGVTIIKTKEQPYVA